jgi:hypothetical protein
VDIRKVFEVAWARIDLYESACRPKAQRSHWFHAGREIVGGVFKAETGAVFPDRVRPLPVVLDARQVAVHCVEVDEQVVVGQLWRRELHIEQHGLAERSANGAAEVEILVCIFAVVLRAQRKALAGRHAPELVARSPVAFRETLPDLRLLPVGQAGF